MAPPKEKIAAAIRAMKAIGIPKHTVKPVLKNLLIVYENNWEYIEAENFRVLADAVLDLQESKVHTISLSAFQNFHLFFQFFYVKLFAFLTNFQVDEQLKNESYKVHLQNLTSF